MTQAMISLCASIDTLAMAYLDDELADEELRDFEMHLHTCASCRERVDGERAALVELRRRLAPPRLPDLVRARVVAQLDAEDVAADRDERRARVREWMLPGFAGVVAVAALVLFVVWGDPAPDADPVAAEVVQQQVRSPRVATDSALPIGNGPSIAASPSLGKVASWDSEVRGRRVATQLYEVRPGDGGRYTVQVSVFDARGWDLEFGDRVSIDGRDLWVTPVRGRYAVVHRADDGVGYVFSSEDLRAEDLLYVVGRYQLIDRVGARLHED